MLLLLSLLYAGISQEPEIGQAEVGWPVKLLQGDLIVEFLDNQTHISQYKDSLDQSIAKLCQLAMPDSYNDPILEDYLGLRPSSKVGQIKGADQWISQEFKDSIKTLIVDHMDVWTLLSEAFGYDADTFKWVIDRLQNWDLLKETTFADIFTKVGLNYEPIVTHGGIVYDSVIDLNSDITIRTVFSTLGVNQDAVAKTGELLKLFGELKAPLTVNALLNGGSGVIRSASESASAALREVTGLIADLFDMLFAHALNFDDYPVSKRLQNVLSAWQKAKTSYNMDADDKEAFDAIAKILQNILDNGLDFNELNKTIGMSDEMFDLVMPFVKALTSGSLYDVLKTAGAMIGTEGFDDLQTLLNSINSGDVSFQKLFGITEVLGFNMLESIQSFVNRILNTPALDLAESFGFNLTDLFLNAQEVAQKILDAQDNAKIGDVLGVSDGGDTQSLLKTLAKLGKTSIADVLNEMLDVDYWSQALVAVGDVLDATMVIPKTVNDLAVVLKPFVEKLVFNYIDRLVEVLRKGTFTVVDLTSIIVPTWSDIISTSFGYIDAVAQNKPIVDFFKVFSNDVLNTKETLKNFAALEFNFTIPQLIYVITPNDNKRLKADNVFTVVQGGATVDALNLIEKENIANVTLNELAATGLNVNTIKTIATDFGSQMSTPALGVMDQSLGTNMKPAMQPLGKIVDKIANKQPVSIDELDSVMKEVTNSYQDDPKGPNVGLIVGVTIACLVIVGVVVGLTVYFLVIRKRKTASSEEEKEEKKEEP